QDAFLKDEEAGIFIVADGMGGHKGGEVASQLAVHGIQTFCRSNAKILPAERLNLAINAACEEIYIRSAENAELKGMGTTVLALLFEKGEAFLAQVGDSRGYLMAAGQLWQITEDHSLLNEELRSGRIAADQIQNYQFKNVITRSVGYENKVAVDVYRRVLVPGDTFLLCTDGLSGLVEAGEMGNEMKKHGIEQGLRTLITLANSRGGDDNITALACQVENL
ncbi:MAG: serine/threonine-protein phosphatase, partial [Proteobacteria bacterium]|nr:serine/threonine-protein phosphatase [Pseudomonadota bacterium]